MTTEAKMQLTSTELGRLWMSYQIKSALIEIFPTLKIIGTQDII